LRTRPRTVNVITLTHMDLEGLEAVVTHGPDDGYAVVRLLLPLAASIGEPGVVLRCFVSEVEFPRRGYISGRAREYENMLGQLFPAQWDNGEFLIRLLDSESRLISSGSLMRQMELSSSLWESAIPDGLEHFIEGIHGYRATLAEVVAVRKISLTCSECANLAVNVATRASLDALYSLQVAYSYSANDPIPILTAETIQPVVMMQLSKFDLDGTLIELEDLRPVIPHIMISRKHQTLTRSSSTDFSTETAGALRAVSGRRIFSRHIELVAESAELIYAQGKSSLGLMAAAQSCEYLLDSILFFLMWWDGLTPKDGASQFESTNNQIASRVKELYGSRLGHRWTPASGVLLRWKNDVARARNRVIHGGSEATLGEAEDALQTARDLRSFVADICALPDNLLKYPPLHALLVGDEMLPDNWAAMTEAEFYEFPGYPAERFRAWVALAQGELSLSIEASTDRAQVLISQMKGGSGFEWFLFDADAHKVVLVDPTSIKKAERRRIEQKNRDLLREGIHARYAKLGLSPLPKPHPDATWRNASTHGPGLPYASPWLN